MIAATNSCVTYERWINGKQKSFEEKLINFRLDTRNSTYAFSALEDGYLLHGYYGKKLGDDDLSYLLRLNENPFTLKSNNRDKGTFMDSKSFEYSCHGTGDYRESCFMVMDRDGMSTADLRYVKYEILKGKPVLKQSLYDFATGSKQNVTIPATWSENGEDCETLVVIMEDAHLGLEARLYYTAFPELDIITRSISFTNKGKESFELRRVLSACIDFEGCNYDFITLNGSWARERVLERSHLHHGKQSVDSVKGESSHQSNPFAALVSPDCNEDSGEAYGFNLVYSGNFMATAEVTQHKRTRFVMGINPFDFAWKLDSGASFQAPELVMSYSCEGMGQMSRNFHDLYRNNLIRGEWKDKRRPILINNWEATYFNFNTEKLISIAKQASKLGIEMLVMDDGWFGHRDSDNSSLGDWFVYEKKIEGGLKYLVDEVNKLGMKFGIWFEPEMISPDSKLYEEHPDWAIQIPGRVPTMSREQYVLDYSNKEVRDYIYGMMKKILDSANIEYIKWDMNRQLTEVGSTTLPKDRQRELWHRYVLGVYDVMNRLTTDYPYLLLENCSGGGARFDAGMLYFSPQIWTSDDTDAIERLKIQHGTSICYPASSMGAHVSDCPNHTVGRTTPFSTRGDVALVGTFGYELDVTRIPENDRNSIPGQIEKFKKYNPLVRTGDHYRIGNIFEDNTWDAWMFVAKDKSEALLTIVQVLGRPNYPQRIFKLPGLALGKKYKLEELNVTLSGETLKNAGIAIEMYGDFSSKTIHLVEA
ncbi:MAG: alpha-galactosidase [Lachnospiraceae bacterium]|nr:alpha-galactosidase [Lachnospiraceae bacterium]